MSATVDWLTLECPGRDERNAAYSHALIQGVITLGANPQR